MASLSRTSCAWASANGEPRVPMRMRTACKEVSPDARRGVRAQWQIWATLMLQRCVNCNLARQDPDEMMPHADPASDSLLVLGVETSCDETAAAVVMRDRSGSGRILSNVVLSQFDKHAIYGGVVPEIAARAHTDSLDQLIRAALAEAGVGFSDISGIAAAAGPG